MRIRTLTIGTTGLAGLVTTGMLAFPVTTAYAGHDHQTAFKRDDDTPAVVLTADDDDDDTNAGTNTNTNTNTGKGTNTNTNTGTHHSRRGDDSHGGQVRDHTSDGPGRGNIDHSRHHTNDHSHHNTRG